MAVVSGSFLGMAMTIQRWSGTNDPRKWLDFTTHALHYGGMGIAEQAHQISSFDPRAVDGQLCRRGCGTMVAIVQSKRTGKWYPCNVVPARQASKYIPLPHRPHRCSE